MNCPGNMILIAIRQFEQPGLEASEGNDDGDQNSDGDDNRWVKHLLPQPRSVRRGGAKGVNSELYESHVISTNELRSYRESS